MSYERYNPHGSINADGLITPDESIIADVPISPDEPIIADEPIHPEGLDNPNESNYPNESNCPNERVNSDGLNPAGLINPNEPNNPDGSNRLHERAIWVRLSDLRDASRLMELDALVWDNRTSPSTMAWASREKYLQQCPPGRQLVAGVEDELCGYLGFASPTAMSCHRHVYDIHIAVHPAYQRQGLGRQLMEAMKRLAAEQGIRKLSLRVLSTNPRAIAFYESCGFKQQGRLVAEYYIDGQYVDDILMWYPITPCL